MVKITGQGLFAIGCAVALLWTYFIAERVTMARARAERAEVMRAMERLRRKRISPPAHSPAVRFPHRQRPVTA